MSDMEFVIMVGMYDNDECLFREADESTASILRMFKPNQLKSLTPEQLVCLSPDQLKGLTADQLKGLTPEQLKGLTPEQLKGLTAEQLSDIPPHVIKKAIELKSGNTD